MWQLGLLYLGAGAGGWEAIHGEVCLGVGLPLGSGSGGKGVLRPGVWSVLQLPWGSQEPA